MADTERKATTSIQVIERMMGLLDVLARHATPVNLKQIAAETRLHPSTAYRILSMMTRSRIAERVEPGCYRLGMRLLELGTLVLSRSDIRQKALPHMQNLLQQVGEAVNLSVRHDDELIHIEHLPCGNPAVLPARLAGMRAPLHVTAVGKLFLAADGREKCLEYATRTGLPKFTDNTLADHAALLAEVETAQRNGYAFEHEEAEQGVSCIGAGVYDDHGRLVAGISIAAPSARFNKAWAVPLKQVSERISRALGNLPAPPAAS